MNSSFVVAEGTSNLAHVRVTVKYRERMRPVAEADYL